MNFTDILGSVLNQGMSRSSNQRLDNSVNQGGLGDLLNSVGGALGGAGSGSGGGLLSSLGKIAGAAMNSGPGGGSNPMVTGGLGALVGALFGGGGSAAKGAMGGTALAVLGSLAMKALQGRMTGGTPTASAQLMAGLRQPENDQEVREVQSIAELTVKAMLNAAKADGQVDRDEIERIVGKLSEDGLSQEEQDFMRDQINRPMDTEGLIRAVPNQQVAAQVYAASLLAIEVDTDAERQYLQTLASGLGLDPTVVTQLHGALGVA